LEDEEEALDREAGPEARAFTRVVLGLVLVAAASGVVQSRAAEASKTVVDIFENDNIVYTSQEMKQSPWGIRIRPVRRWLVRPLGVRILQTDSVDFHHAAGHLEFRCPAA
jgi:hypothetical protein